MKVLITLVFGSSIAFAQIGPLYGPGGGYGFDSKYGFIPNGITTGRCHGFLNLPGSLRDGMIGTLEENSIKGCEGISQWRITEIESNPGQFFAAVYTPMSKPLIVDWNAQQVIESGLGRLMDEIECTSIETTAAPIDNDHESIKTEDCLRVLYGAIGVPTETLRGQVLGWKNAKGNRRVVSQFKRWTIKLTNDERIWGYDVAVVEAFSPEHGNARWHEDQYQYFYNGEPDVVSTDCPPGDHRDVLPIKAAKEDYNIQNAHWVATHLDGKGNIAGVPNGMTLKQSKTDGDYYTSRQNHWVEPGGPLGCVAVVLLTHQKRTFDDWAGKWIEPEDALKIHEIMTSGEDLHIQYTPVWHRQHIWFKRRSDNPDYIWNHRLRHTELNNQTSDTVITEKECSCKE